MTDELAQLTQKAQELARNFQFPDNICSYYDQMEPEVYEHMLKVINYTEITEIVDNVAKLLLPTPQNLRVLDAGAGTGAIGKVLAPHGFSHIDAVDGST
jgi:2-polyprenyl-3-methyl-5-hydroxy-6-metoxy-1,4-benzoquinol methylase